METTTEQSKVEFTEVLDQLTDESRQELLGVLEGLYFAQNKENNDE